MNELTVTCAVSFRWPSAAYPSHESRGVTDSATGAGAPRGQAPGIGAPVRAADRVWQGARSRGTRPTGTRHASMADADHEPAQSGAGYPRGGCGAGCFDRAKQARRSRRERYNIAQPQGASVNVTDARRRFEGCSGYGQGPPFTRGSKDCDIPSAAIWTFPGRRRWFLFLDPRRSSFSSARRCCPSDRRSLSGARR